MASHKPFDLEDRLIEFAVKVINMAESLPITFAGKHLGGQIVRSCSSPALHYGEAQSAESKNDFIHKMKVCTKELKETFSCLKLINKLSWISDGELISLLDENNQLISIFVKSIETAKRNAPKELKNKELKNRGMENKEPGNEEQGTEE
ncbi:MAG: four helix bundle protein [Chitinophagaceae bacterium]|nr:MAG: four helix bundle protein [Chitinophagaceae bacterium]